MSMRRFATTSAEATGPARPTTAAQPMCDLMPSATGFIAGSLAEPPQGGGGMPPRPLAEVRPGEDVPALAPAAEGGGGLDGGAARALGAPVRSARVDKPRQANLSRRRCRR